MSAASSTSMQLGGFFTSAGVRRGSPIKVVDYLAPTLTPIPIHPPKQPILV
ncbi:hypothetical protein EGR_10849 [Echinococcus granulosus]|uniref:Uncharacterized protein n=1 Tax=Echinococcus granulosus TaxID=6210 RepID=W6TZW0_ECHGR|nr:hypothetical protein EGR_10849 [Echinococcus granulosus]EUB54288.1 hypothetical protein EGR_10849 [Echinococcus granulosus]